MSARLWSALVTGALLSAACGGVSSPRTPSSQPPASGAGSASSQELYEAGRYQDVVSRVSAMPPDSASPRELWFAGQSYVSLGQQAEAQATFERLQSSGDDAWRATARLAAATVSGDGAAIDAARGAAAAHPGHPFAQYQLGVALMRQGALADAAAALDRSAAADPTLAYAYYYAGLAYQKLNRPDVMANRFDTFLRLAPNAPQRPEVQAIMTTLRG